LKEVEFNGWVSIEDGNSYGDEGFKKSISNIRAKIAQTWG
jgi:sugar phosphate isomerase/epimerase